MSKLRVTAQIRPIKEWNNLSVLGRVRTRDDLPIRVRVKGSDGS